jgi:3-isopropylmalate/(R)-2-methylmalate dehydratase large subunit
MPMTLCEKILAAHAGRSRVESGEFILARVDLSMANDVTAPLSIEAFKEAGGERLKDPSRVVLVMDHFTPNKDIASAAQVLKCRRFASTHSVENYHECEGIAHVLLPEMGLIKPGDLIIGADSHTCTYGALGAFSTGVGSTDLAAAWLTGMIWLKVPPTIKLLFQGTPGPWITGKDLILRAIGEMGTGGANYCALEMSGEAVRALTMADRFTMANMSVEMGAKAALFECDSKTRSYLKQSGIRLPNEPLRSDPDAEFLDVRTFNVSSMEPQVAAPPSPANVHGVREMGSVRIDQVFIGSCTNGRAEDLRIACRILSGRKIHKDLRCIVIPATRRVYLQALREGLIEILLEAGAVVGPPSCGPCLGGHLGILAEGERCLSTTNRNFVGRMGDPKSEVYLSGPAVAAASAVAGRIIHPDDLVH